MIQVHLHQISALISAFFLLSMFSYLLLSLNEALRLLELKYFCSSLSSLLNFLSFSEGDMNLSISGMEGEIVVEGSSINFSSNRHTCEIKVLREMESTKLEVNSKLMLVKEGHRIYFKNG